MSLEPFETVRVYTPSPGSPFKKGSTMSRLRSSLACVVLLITLACSAAVAQQASADTRMPDAIPVPAAAQPSPNFNAEAATDAYLAEIPATARARSNAYFEGGYWLILWDFLYGAVIALILLNLRWSAAMRNLAERITRFKPLQTAIYWTQYLILATILGFPLAVYEGFIREKKYGLATQTLGGWMGDQVKGLLVGLVLGGIALIILFGLVRRLQRTWWIWGAGVSVIFLIVLILIGPVFIQPIFNTPKLLDNPKITKPILAMARANGIPARDVWQIDASKQSTRMSANVSGFGRTMRITLNDNLLHRASPEEIQAVMGHEMGHYVLNHIYKDILFFSVVYVLFFALLYWSLGWSLKRWGEKWQIRSVGDTAVLPLAVMIISIFGFVLTPIFNTWTRTAEAEADMYGLNASRQPDGFARAAIHLGEYRKMSPGPVEEWIFYDHPSGRNRIYRAMRWKAENLESLSEPKYGVRDLQNVAQSAPATPAQAAASTN
jgi:STE24 endopeptidase